MAGGSLAIGQSLHDELNDLLRWVDINYPEVWRAWQGEELYTEFIQQQYPAVWVEWRMGR